MTEENIDLSQDRYLKQKQEEDYVEDEDQVINQKKRTGESKRNKANNHERYVGFPERLCLDCRKMFFPQAHFNRYCRYCTSRIDGLSKCQKVAGTEYTGSNGKSRELF